MTPNDSHAAALARLPSVGDVELLALMERISAAERTLSVYALVHLAEIQRRKLYADVGFTSMFMYCVGKLRYSEANAYRRLQAADAIRKFPEILALIRDGDLTVCALSHIAKHLTFENRGRLLKQIEGKSVRVVERLAAEMAPRPDTRDTIRSTSAPADAALIDWLPAGPRAAVPEPAPSSAPPAGPAPLRIMPLSPGRVWFGFTGSEELRGVVDRLKELLWHKYPDGRLEDLLLEIGRAYLALKDPALQLPSAPRPPRNVEKRAVPRWVRSAVYRRDEGRCVFTSGEGRRCETRRSLEYDHILPWAKGGSSDDPGNIRLLCRAHNQLAARREGLA